MNTKIGEIENKIPYVTDLVKKTNYDAKIKHIKKRYFTTAAYNKFASETLDAKIKQKELFNKLDISNLVNFFDLNTKLVTLATKADLKAEQDKILKLKAFDSSCFHGKNCFCNDDFQKMFVYQPKFNTLELKKDKGTHYVIGWKSKILFESKLLSLHGAFSSNIKHFGCKIGIRFNNTHLVVEQNNYRSKTVSAYIGCDLGN